MAGEIDIRTLTKKRKKKEKKKKRHDFIRTGKVSKRTLGAPAPNIKKKFADEDGQKNKLNLVDKMTKKVLNHQVHQVTQALAVIMVQDIK